MRTYIISYDLRLERNYEVVYEAIKSYGTWAKILESVWAVKTDQTAKEVRDFLSSKIDNNDGLLVIRSGTEAAWQSVECTNEWLIDNL